MSPTAKKNYSPESYAAKIAAGGLTRRQEINRLEYTRALLNDPKITWRQAQARLDTSQTTILNQMARMKDADKQKWAEFHKNDYKTGNKAWQSLAKKNPDQKAEILRNQKLAQFKMVYGKDVLTDKQKKKVNAFLDTIVQEGEDFGSYWGY